LYRKHKQNKMKQLFTNFFTWVLIAGTFATGQDLIHYWNFNNDASVADLLTPSETIGGAQITHIQGASISEVLVGTGQNFDIDNLNARNGDPAGAHLRFNDPIGGILEFELPTTGYENVVVSFATRRSGSGAGDQLWYFSLNGGVDYTLFTTIQPNNGDPALETLNFTSIAGANDNADFRIKVEFEQGLGGTVGNNRFDNFAVDADPLPVLNLLHYWNFNDDATLAELITPTETIGGGEINHIQASGISEMLAATGQNFDVDNHNARNGDIAGAHLRFNDPIGDAIEFVIPTTGFEDILIQFATRRSGSGAGEQNWFFSLNGGVDYTFFSTILPNNGDPGLEVLNFASIPGANDNADFRIKVEFEQGLGGTVGNNRFDNFTVEGFTLGSGGPANDPELTVDATGIAPFEQTIGYPSAEQTFTVSGTDLTDDLEITVTGDFEISLTSGGPFSASLTLPVTFGFVSNTTIHVRLNATALGSSTGEITISTTGADDETIALEGTTEEEAVTLLYYWHFNNWTATSDVTEIDADFSLISGVTGRFEYTDPIEGERDIDSYSPGSSINSQMGMTPGFAARVRNPAATRTLTFDVPTTGAENIVFTYVVQRSNNGSQSNTIEYSLDGGTTFITTGLVGNVQPITDFEVWTILTYDFSGIAGANDNPNFKIRIIFEDANAANPSGNNRYDNITITGNALIDDLSLSQMTKTSIQVYPNPAEDLVNVSAGEMIENMFVFNSVGGLVAEFKAINTQETTINTDAYNAGMYLVLIQTPSGYAQVKFVKK
jgi:hypothetical protein